MKEESGERRNLNDGATVLQREADTQDKISKFLCSPVHLYLSGKLKATGSRQVKGRYVKTQRTSK